MAAPTSLLLLVKLVSNSGSGQFQLSSCPRTCSPGLQRATGQLVSDTPPVLQMAPASFQDLNWSAGLSLHRLLVTFCWTKKGCSLPVCLGGWCQKQKNKINAARELCAVRVQAKGGATYGSKASSSIASCWGGESGPVAEFRISNRHEYQLIQAQTMGFGRWRKQT